MVHPIQKPGKSKQDYGTPLGLIDAVEARFGALEVDLAATRENAIASIFVTPADDSLSLDWVERFGGKHCWLNPPFGNIAPWAEKCVDFSRRSPSGRIYLLTPASVGSNWYANHVDGKAYVIALQGRLTFVGETTPYPKDCILSLFGSRIHGNEVWKWNER
jgi:phage N-6-adenine-methyltransferase